MCLFTLFVSSQNLKSPNNNLDLNFSIDENGRATYNLNYHDNPVILNSGLGFILKDNVEWMKVDTLDMVNNFKVVNVSFDSMDEIWSPVWGEESKIRNNYNEMYVELEQEGSQRKVNIRFRLFDDSLGFRYEFPLQENLGSFIVIDEKTEFAMAGDHTAIWIPGDYDTQEYNYITSKLSEIKQKSIDFKEENVSMYRFSDWGVQTALMMKSNEGLYINIHEAALIEYSAMHLEFNPSNMTFESHLTPDAYGNMAYMNAPHNTPWRTIITSDDARDILVYFRAMLGLF